MTIESRNLTPSAPVPVPPATPAVPATSSEALSATAVAPLATSAVPTATAAVPAAPVGMATYPSQALSIKQVLGTAMMAPKLVKVRIMSVSSLNLILH